MSKLSYKVVSENACRLETEVCIPATKDEVEAVIKAVTLLKKYQTRAIDHLRRDQLNPAGNFLQVDIRTERERVVVHFLSGSIG
jgi:hypothetical protein